jgi:trimeric autotransporter adhesin
MSTKTTFKRVALVAVAALGLGVLSVAPSQADPISVTLTPSATTSAITTAETATISIAASAVLGDTNDSLTVRAVVTSSNSATKGTLEFRGTSDSTTTRFAGAGTSAFTLDSTTVSNGTLVRGTINLNLIKPTVKGTYTVLVYSTSKTAGTIATTADKSFVWTVTVTSDSTDATTATTSFIGAGTASAPTADAVVFGSKAAASTTKKQVATILVTQSNGTNTADEPLNVFVSGPGYIVAAADTITANTANARALQTTGASQKYILVFADGTAGPSTITIVGSVTGTVLATEKLTFTDTKPAAVAVAVKKAYVAAGKATVKTFAVTVTDASGNAVTDSVITATRTDTTTAGKLLATGALTCGGYDSTDKVYYCASNGASTVVFGKAEYKFTATGIDADETAVSTTASTTYSDVVAKTATLTAPATANVGDKITYTLTLTDKNGYPVADTTYEGAFGNGDTSGQYGGIVWNTTTVPAYSSSVKPFNAGETITTVSGVATVDVYVPSVAGTITNTWVLAGKSTAAAGAIDASIGGTTLTTSTVVTNPGVDAATDAANEATDAANAATDAALAAADAADAATAAAQDASDAVAALSASVSKLISSLRAQITSLTNLVIKIQKKVRA